MKRFFLNAGILSVVIILTIVFLVAVVVPALVDHNIYEASSIEKEKRLHAINVPKIVLIGGSNLSFGMDSKLIEKKFNMPVVNMGLHAGLGLRFMLNEAVSGVKESDVVLISTEYYLDKPQMEVLAELISSNPDGKKYLDLGVKDRASLYVAELQNCIIELSLNWRKSVTKDEDIIYRRNGLTAEGDVISHLNMKNVMVTPSKLVVGDYTNDIQLLNAFIDNLKKKKARVYYLFPAYQMSSYLLNKETIADFAKTMKENLRCKVINTPETFAYNDSLFFNTAYHLNKIGRQMRTQSFINILDTAVFNKKK